jgi:hypothetical protein
VGLDIKRSNCKMRILVSRCGLPATWVIGNQGGVRSAPVYSEEACRNVRQMAPLVTLDERVVAVQTRRSEPQEDSVVKHVLLGPVGRALGCTICLQSVDRSSGVSGNWW